MIEINDELEIETIELEEVLEDGINITIDIEKIELKETKEKETKEKETKKNKEN